MVFGVKLNIDTIHTMVPLGPIAGVPIQKAYRIGGLFPLGPTLSGPIIGSAWRWDAPIVKVVRRGPAMLSFRRVSTFDKILLMESQETEWVR